MNILQAEFVKVYVQFTYNKDFKTTRTYTITRQDEGVEDDIKYLEQKEIEFWNNYVVKDIRPNTQLPEI